MNTFKQSAENDFNAWFASLQNVLDEDTAGHLLNLIQNNTARIELIEAVLFNDITANPFLILFDNLDGIVSTAFGTPRCKGSNVDAVRLHGRGIIVCHWKYLHGASPALRRMRRGGGGDPRDYAQRPRSNDNHYRGGLRF